MNQEKIGGFIAALRKEKAMTQAELGEKLGVTNKTVSRWENGNYMPDISILPTLCNELGVSINELLSGQRLEEFNFRAQADVNLMASLRQRLSIRKQKLWGERCLALGIGLLVSTTYAPESWRRAAVFWLSLLLIVTGWFLRWKVERTYGIDE